MSDKEIREFKVELCKASIMRLNANGFKWEKANDELYGYDSPLFDEDIDKIVNDEDELCHIHQLLEDLEEKYC